MKTAIGITMVALFFLGMGVEKDILIQTGIPQKYLDPNAYPCRDKDMRPEPCKGALNNPQPTTQKTGFDGKAFYIDVEPNTYPATTPHCPGNSGEVCMFAPNTTKPVSALSEKQRCDKEGGELTIVYKGSHECSSMDENVCAPRQNYYTLTCTQPEKVLFTENI